MRSIIGFGLGCSLLLACSDGGGGVPDAGSDAPGACSASSSGSLVVNVHGLPASVNGIVSVTGAAGDQTVHATQTLTLAGGNYTIAATRVVVDDPFARAVYDATVSADTVCVGGAPVTVDVTYTMIPTSNKLWAINGNGGAGSLLGFASSSLASSGSPSATVAADGPAGRSIAFDRDGNLWAFGATTGDATLVRFPAASLATGGTKTPDRSINVPSIACIPSGSELAFDKAGNLWMSAACDHSVSRLTPAMLAASGDATPDVKLGGLGAPTGLAFDTSGALFVGDNDANRVHRFDASQLGASTSSPAMSLDVVTPNPSSVEIRPDLLAFDHTGALWVTDFGGNTFSKLAQADISGTGTTATAGVVITVGAAALIDSIAFDESGGLWMTYSAGNLARLDPSQLGTSTNAGSPTTPMTIISSPDVGYAGAIAFFAPPSNIPIFAQP